MYPPALKGLFNFLRMRPHTHDCNYVQQRVHWWQFSGDRTAFGFGIDQYISIQVIRESERFPRCPLSRKLQKKKRLENE